MAGPSGNENAEDKTEPATPHRREEFRKQGKVALSREVLSVVLLLATGGVLLFSGQHFLREFGVVAESFFGFDGRAPLGKAQFLELMWTAGRGWAGMVWPIFLTTVIAGLVVCVAQVGFHVTLEPLSPDFNKLNPVNGFKRIFSPKSLMEAVKVIFKMSLGCLVLFLFIRGLIPELGHHLREDVRESIALQFSTVSSLFFTLLAVFAVVAALDYAFQRFQLEKEMKMTKREARDELKLREGDPLIKSRIKGLQRRIASRRMMEDVPKADVVVTNPTHLSVAIQYNENLPAPKVLAKGAGNVALKIRELARLHQIPIVENKPLARTIFRKIEIGKYVPRELYKAIAEVLAYVFRLRNQFRGNG